MYGEGEDDWDMHGWTGLTVVTYRYGIDLVVYNPVSRSLICALTCGDVCADP